MRLGELFAGYGGLGMAVEEVFGAELAWVSEFDPAPSKILAHHWPHVPNHGDITKIDWNAIEPVDIISGGSPCQDLSLAGARRGMTEGTRSNLWETMREGIATIKPKHVVWENVRGALSAEAVSASDMGHREGFLGERGGHLRALGRVLGDLADLGYDAEWRGLRASDVGAPPTDASASSSLLPTVTTSESTGPGNGPNKTGGDNLRTVVSLLPTPTTRDHKDNTIRREPHRPNDTDTLARALTGVNTPGLFVDGKPCMEPHLPL
jgi:DNA (cytosine-5)-methyltransferase 1